MDNQLHNQIESTLDAGLKLAKDAFKTRLIAAYALGSIAHGGFAPLVSDVDMAFIIEDPIDSDDPKKISFINSQAKSSLQPLVDRLSVYWGSVDTLKNNTDLNNDKLGRFPPLDKLDLIKNGRLLYGKDIRDQIPQPTQADLITIGASFSHTYLNRLECNDDLKNPNLIYNGGIHKLTKVILLPVRLLYTAWTGKIGKNDDAVGYYLANNSGDIAELVKNAFNWRNGTAVDPQTSIELMQKAIIPLYVQFIDVYTKLLTEYGQTDLANSLIKWKAILLDS